MLAIAQKEPVWEYLSATQKDLLKEGYFLMETMESKGYHFKDYSFLVFPFAKAYEGYLKQLFLDLGFISHLQYVSDHFRVGKFLTPHLVHHLKDRSIYKKIREHATEDLAWEMWDVWKTSRNEVFHYYPHNLKRLTYQEAQTCNSRIIQVMKDSYTELKK